MMTVPWQSELQRYYGRNSNWDWIWKLIRKGREAGKADGKAEEIIEMGQEFGLDDADILKRLQEKIGVSLETAVAYLERYGKQLV